MIIGFDGSRAFTSNRTGTENYSYQLLKHLSRIDNKNQYIVYLRPGVEVSKDWPDNFRFKTLNFKRLWTQLGLAIETFTNPIDILFVPAHTYPVIHKRGLPIVMTVHDLGVEYLPGMHQLKQQLYLKFITYLHLQSAAKLIAVSQATKEDLIMKAQISPKKIEVIYEGGRFELYQRNDVKVDILNRFDIRPDNYFLFVGTVQPRKNLSRLIKAFKAYFSIYGNAKLVIAGGKGWLSEDIYALPKRLGIADEVIFTGRVTDEELAYLYKHAIALVFPSLFEGFGLPILEAFYHQCPVITSAVSAMPEVAGDAGLLVDPYKIEPLIDCMIQISSDKELRNELRDKGLKRLEKFSWEKCAKETLQLLHQVKSQ